MFEGRGAEGLRLPARFVAAARVGIVEGRGLAVLSAGPEIAFSGEPYTAVLSDGGAFHYFHLMESLCWLWILQHRFLGGRPPARIVLSTEWAEARLHGVGLGIMAALYPGVTLCDRASAWPADFAHSLIVERDLCETTLNKYLQAGMVLGSSCIPAMGAKARHAVRAHDQPGRLGRILYVQRPPPRCLAEELELGLLARLEGIATVNPVDFAVLPWEHQVRVAATHDVMIGVHGNGLTNALWMRPGCAVIEFFSPGAHHYDYQFFAELAGLRYMGFDGNRVFEGGRRYGDACGHNDANNVRIDELAVERVIEEVRRLMPS
jgi:hypothetical protein